MKRKVRIIPLSLGKHNINIYVRDNRQVGITALECKDFILMDINGNIFKPYACTENPLCYYELRFNESKIDKIRIKLYGVSTKFIKIE